MPFRLLFDGPPPLIPPPPIPVRPPVPVRPPTVRPPNPAINIPGPPTPGPAPIRPPADPPTREPNPDPTQPPGYIGTWPPSRLPPGVRGQRLPGPLPKLRPPVTFPPITPDTHGGLYLDLLHQLCQEMRLNLMNDLDMLNAQMEDIMAHLDWLIDKLPFLMKDRPHCLFLLNELINRLKDRKNRIKTDQEELRAMQARVASVNCGYLTQGPASTNLAQLNALQESFQLQIQFHYDKVEAQLNRAHWLSLEAKSLTQMTDAECKKWAQRAGLPLSNRP